MMRASPALAALVLLGCGSDKATGAPSDAPRGPRHRIPSEEVAAVKKPVAATSDTRVVVKTEKPLEAKPEEKEKRDYDAELRAAVGSPVHCLKPRKGPDVPGEIRIDIDATVVEMGMVTRAYARSSQLDEEELACVQRQLTTLRMRAPIEAAPRSVHATIVLERQQTAPAPAERESPEESGP